MLLLLFCCVSFLNDGMAIPQIKKKEKEVKKKKKKDGVGKR